MTCKNCGAEVPAEAEFCPKCGFIAQRGEPKAVSEEQKKEIPEKFPERERKGVSTGLLVALLVIASLLLVSVSALILDLCGVIDLPFIQLFGEGTHTSAGSSGDLPEGITKLPKFEADPNNAGRYLVTVWAKPGTVLIYETNAGTREQTETPAAGRVIFSVDVSSLIPNEPIEGETCAVTPKVLKLNADGTESVIGGFTPIEVNVPAITAAIEDPFVEKDAVMLTGHIIPFDSTITVNGESVSVGAEGSFSHTLTFAEEGEHTVILEARHNGYSILTRSFTVTTEAPDPAAIEFPWEYGDTTFSQRVKNNIDFIEVRGRVPAGSSVTASCSSEYAELTEPTVAGDGTFTFIVKMAEAGDYSLNITCVAPSGETVERVMHVQRAPDWRAYVERSWAMSYEELTHASKQPYKLSGTVTRVIEDGDSILAVLEFADGRSVLLRYHHHYASAGSLAEGSVHTGIYGHSLGRNDEGTPVIYVWFVID